MIKIFKWRHNLLQHETFIVINYIFMNQQIADESVVD